jgi:hypothetical protein
MEITLHLFHMCRINRLNHTLGPLFRYTFKMIFVLLQISQALQKLAALDGLNMSHPHLPWNMCGPHGPIFSLSLPLSAHMDPDAAPPAHMDPYTARPAHPSLPACSAHPGLPTARPILNAVRPIRISTWLAGQDRTFPLAQPPGPCLHPSASHTRPRHPHHASCYYLPSGAL